MEQALKKERINAYRQRKQVGCVYEICCTQTDRCIVRADIDAQGAENRFSFSKMTGSCVSPCMQADWKQYGAGAFTFRFLEKLEKTETQTDAEFREDLKALEALLLENYPLARRYEHKK